LKYRPAFYAAIPPEWTLIEKGTSGEVGINRPDLPTGKTRFGVVMYRRQLSQEEVSQFELEQIGDEHDQ
jgi:hypothetical protein